MSKVVRCFLNGDPKNFYYLPNITEIKHDENDKYLGYPLTKSGFVEDGCVFVPDIADWIDDVCEPYDSMLNGTLMKENMPSSYNSIERAAILEDWDKYKAIINCEGYTKDGFDIQKLKELGFTLPLFKNPLMVNPDREGCSENTKSPANDESLDPNAIIEESIKTFNAKYAELGGDPENLDCDIFEKALKFVIDGNFDATTKNLAKEAMDYIKSRRK